MITNNASGNTGTEIDTEVGPITGALIKAVVVAFRAIILLIIAATFASGAFASVLTVINMFAYGFDGFYAVTEDQIAQYTFVKDLAVGWVFVLVGILATSRFYATNTKSEA